MGIGAMGRGMLLVGWDVLFYGTITAGLILGCRFWLALGVWGK